MADEELSAQEKRGIELLLAAYERWADMPPTALTLEAEIVAPIEAGIQLMLNGGPTSTGMQAALMRMHPDFLGTADTSEPVRIEMSRRDAFELLGAFQALLLHPGVAGTVLAELYEQVGRSIQDGVVDDPELYALMETGWDPDLAVEM
ncbi:hypothetical protein GCM10022221_67200 [Actinocorallia aurea]